MILTAKEAVGKGLTPVVVFDANGLEIKEEIIELNTETGEVCIVDRDSTGRIQFSEDGEEIKRRMEKYPAPLTWRSLR